MQCGVLHGEELERTGEDVERLFAAGGKKWEAGLDFVDLSPAHIAPRLQNPTQTSSTLQNSELSAAG